MDIEVGENILAVSDDEDLSSKENRSKMVAVDTKSFYGSQCIAKNTRKRTFGSINGDQNGHKSDNLKGFNKKKKNSSTNKKRFPVKEELFNRKKNLCKTCHMQYIPGHLIDEEDHARYHDLFIAGLKFNWKNERIIKYYDDGSCIVSVMPDDPKYMLKKIDDLFSIADLELGIRVNLESSMKPSSLYLFHAHIEKSSQSSKASIKKKITGFVAAEEVKLASPLISEEPLCVSTNLEESEIGVNRLWVHPMHRRQHIATKLMEVLRANFYKDHIIPRDKIAFSDPTICGKNFAKQYIGAHFLIFQ